MQCVHKIPMGQRLHERSSLSSYLFVMKIDVLTCGFKKNVSRGACCLLLTLHALCSDKREKSGKRLEEWKMDMEHGG